jgi:hypothetical protein
MTCVHYASIASSSIIEASHSVLKHAHYSVLTTYYQSWQQSHHFLQDLKYHVTPYHPRRLPVSPRAPCETRGPVFCHTQHVILETSQLPLRPCSCTPWRLMRCKPLLLHGMRWTKMSSRPLVRPMQESIHSLSLQCPTCSPLPS